MGRRGRGRADGAVVLTGGAGGIGAATAARLVGDGRHVVVTDLDAHRAAAVAGPLGPSATAAALDVTDPEACRALAQRVAAEQGLAVWVNNAGVLRTGPAFEAEAAGVDHLFAVNTHGVIHGTRAALDVFRGRGAGQVVNVVSLAGLVAPPGETLYAATKHAALAYSLGMQQDLRLAGYRGIHVSAVCPDGVWTPMLYDHIADPHAAPSWQGVMLQPEDVAEAIARVVARPRPVVSVPRRRGLSARFYAAFPRLMGPFVGLVMRRARSRQAAFARRHEVPGGSARDGG